MNILKTVLFSSLLSIHLSAITLEVGDNAPRFSLQKLTTTADKQITEGIQNYRGKLIYLDFWASWCGPCRQSLPILEKLRNQYKSKGFEVVAINVDENLQDALNFLKKYPVSYPILLDPNGNSAKTYNIKGMPTAYLIDKNGVVLFKHEGFKKRDRKKIEKHILESLNNS